MTTTQHDDDYFFGIPAPYQRKRADEPVPIKRQPRGMKTRMASVKTVRKAKRRRANGAAKITTTQFNYLHDAGYTKAQILKLKLGEAKMIIENGTPPHVHFGGK